MSSTPSSSTPAASASSSAAPASVGAGDTIPGSIAFARIDDDDRFRAFIAYANDARAFLADKAWDNLAHVERFARASSMAKPLVDAWSGAAERRRIAHALYALLPESARTSAFVPFVDEVAQRAPDFRIFPGDIPRIAPAYAQFLACNDVVEQLVKPGSHVLAPRSVCPGALAGARGSCVVVDVDAIVAGRVRGRVRATSKSGAEYFVDVRLGPDQKPILGADGKPEPISFPVDVAAAWIFSAGPDARGLDLRSDDDRALLLAYAHELRRRNVRDRSLFQWLEDNGAPLDVRIDVVTACVQCAVDVVARHALDPIACRISLRDDGGDGDWQRKAAAFLDDTGLFRDALLRSAGRPPTTPPTQTPATSTKMERDIVWLDAIAPPGFAAGRMSAVAAGRAFARLATSLLAPLGVLPMSGLRDGSGAVVLQRIVPESDASLRLDGARVVTFAPAQHRALADAWRAGDALGLPEPKGALQHDVTQMPAWLTFFLEGLA